MAYGQGFAGTVGQRNSAIGAFVQDDWRITPHLTLNFGLRWQVFTPDLRSARPHDQLRHVQRRRSNWPARTATAARSTTSTTGSPISCRASAWPGRRGRQDGDARGVLALQLPGRHRRVQSPGHQRSLECRSGRPVGRHQTVGDPRQPGHARPGLRRARLHRRGVHRGQRDLGAGVLLCRRPHPRHRSELPARRFPISGTSRMQRQFGNSHHGAGRLRRAAHRSLAAIYNMGQNVLLPNGTAVPGPYLSGNPTLKNDGTGQQRLNTSTGIQNYNALQLTAQQRLTNGLAFQFNYTWSKCLTNNQGYYGRYGNAAASQTTADVAFQSYVYNMTLDYGLCDPDVGRKCSAAISTTTCRSATAARSARARTKWSNAILGDWRYDTILSAAWRLPDLDDPVRQRSAPAHTSSRVRIASRLRWRRRTRTSPAAATSGSIRPRWRFRPRASSAPAGSRPSADRA